MSETQYIPEVVIVHKGLTDPTKILKWAGIKAPCSVQVFTSGSDQNEKLSMAAFIADHVMVEDEEPDGDADKALWSQAFSSRPHTSLVFGENGTILSVSAPGYGMEYMENRLFSKGPII